VSDEAVGAPLAAPSSVEQSATSPEFLYRFGLERESAANLERDCEAAVANGFPHGVSVTTTTERTDASRAVREEVELYFAVTKTGKRTSHFTVELPHPVTDEVADRFNNLFGRAE
jgi:hypothetical protein